MTGLLWHVVLLCMPVCETMRGVLYISTDTLCSFVQQMLMAVTMFSYNKTRYFRPLHTSTARTMEKIGLVFGQRCRCVDKKNICYYTEIKLHLSMCASMYVEAFMCEGERKSLQRATATEWCQCNLSIVSCLVSCSKLWSVSIDQRKNLLPLTFDSSIDHFLLYTVKGKYSDSTRHRV